MALPFFGVGIRTDIFQSCGHHWVFQICWYIECSTLTASLLGFMIAHLDFLALFIVLLPKACLTSHPRMSGSMWVTTPSLLSKSLRPFLYSSSAYSCHLFLISSASVRSLLFLSLTVPIFPWIVPTYLQFSWKDL